VSFEEQRNRKRRTREKVVRGRRRERKGERKDEKELD
jgi:hypothetical protein